MRSCLVQYVKSVIISESMQYCGTVLRKKSSIFVPLKEVIRTWTFFVPTIKLEEEAFFLFFSSFLSRYVLVYVGGFNEIGSFWLNSLWQTCPCSLMCVSFVNKSVRFYGWACFLIVGLLHLDILSLLVAPINSYLQCPYFLSQRRLFGR